MMIILSILLLLALAGVFVLGRYVDKQIIYSRQLEIDVERMSKDKDCDRELINALKAENETLKVDLDRTIAERDKALAAKATKSKSTAKKKFALNVTEPSEPVNESTNIKSSK